MNHQIAFPFDKEFINFQPSNGQANKVFAQDRSFHNWYRFVLSYPPHLVRDYLTNFDLKPGQSCLDPFCGTGTTIVESRLRGFTAYGLEANPIAHFASTVKTTWNINPFQLIDDAREIAAAAHQILLSQEIDDEKPFKEDFYTLQLRHLPEEAATLLLTNSISPVPLHKSLVLLELIRKAKSHPAYNHWLLALANALVFSISNLHFGPEVGVRKPKIDTQVIAPWLANVQRMADDIQSVQGQIFPQATIHHADSRVAASYLAPASIDAVITSPPYPNEKDYTRTTRLESVILGFINNKAELRALKGTLVRSNTRSVYVADQDHLLVADNQEVQRIAREIEARRLALGKTSGFEKLYPRVTQLYFGGMARHLADLRPILRPGAQLAYVVGDQASYLRIMIRTGQILAQIAESLGYQLDRIDLFRTRFATATKEELREEVVVLRWPGE